MKSFKVGDFPLSEPKAKAKPLAKVSGLLIGLTALVSIWLLYEVGLLKFTQVSAADKTETSLESLQRSVQDREKTVQEKEEAIAKREAAVADKETALTEQIKGYERTIEELRRKAEVPGPKVEEKPDEFLSIYEKMEAKRAAKIFEKLELPVATKFLKQMSPSRAAEILGLMPSERARMITERHLSRETASAKEAISGQ
jgi:flagellar motility protein MotE (MotC chaperone)